MSNVNASARPRAVVTGIGVQCAFASNYEQFRTRLKHEGIQHRHVIAMNNLERITADDYTRIDNRSLMDFNEYGIDSLQEAMKHAQLTAEMIEEIKYQAGLVYATSTEDTNTFLYRTFCEDDALFGQKFSEYVQQQLPINGAISVCDSSCSAGGIAAGKALDLIKYDDHKVVFLGGIETITLMQHSGFSILGALGSNGSQPYSQDRDGVGLGSASVFLILEEYEHALKRNAPILGEVISYGMSNDAYHITAPHPEGLGARLAMQRAIEAADINAQHIGYLNGHGTGTSTNDAMELIAVTEVFQHNTSPVAVSSIKSLTGHTLSAAGVIELAATITAIHEQFLIPNWQLHHPMEHHPCITLSTEAVHQTFDYAMSNSFAFGGNCVSVIVKKVPQEVKCS